MSVKGYKVFNPDWTCRGFQYAVGQTYEMELPVIPCERGFHFCKKAADCFNHYSFNSKNKVAEVIAHGTIEEEGDKCCTDVIEIVREISWQEVLTLVNTGKDCTGRCNTGDWNTGDCNTGNCNTGDWNRTSFSNGCFNTVEPKIYMFNKPSDWTYYDWMNSRACELMREIDNCPLEYVWYGDMTAEERAAHPEAETIGGYLKERTTADNARKWWAGLSAIDRNTILTMPNFDAAIFKEITGVDVNE